MTRVCPSPVLHSAYVCDGYGAAHGPVAVPEVHQGTTLYRPGCYLGCPMPGLPLAGSTAMALAVARRAMYCEVGVDQPCGHTSETTLRDVYGPGDANPVDQAPCPP